MPNAESGSKMGFADTAKAVVQIQLHLHVPDSLLDWHLQTAPEAAEDEQIDIVHAETLHGPKAGCSACFPAGVRP